MLLRGAPEVHWYALHCANRHKQTALCAPMALPSLVIGMNELEESLFGYVFRSLSFISLIFTLQQLGL